jgi:hypothetical protein
VSDDIPKLDSTIITEPLDSLLAALGHKIEREWPSGLHAVRGARELFLLTFRLAAVTYRSVRFLSADKPPDSNRKLEYCLSVPPLNRSILDNLFTVMFVLEDLPERCLWYHKAEWREQVIEFQRYKSEYGHLADWQVWLNRLSGLTDLGVKMFGISPEEVAQPLSIVRWPNAGAMVTYCLSPTVPVPPNRAFMKYLNDWFYADLSQQSHLGGTGLMKRASALIRERDDPEREVALNKNKYTWMGLSFALMLALSSEMETFFKFGLRERLNYLWGITGSAVVVAKGMHEKRYKDLLG